MRPRFTQWQVYDGDGRRKYLSTDERRRLLATLDTLGPSIRALGYLLAFTGCRVSEALDATRHQLDVTDCRITLRTLKRRRLIFRSIPIPQHLTVMLTALPIAPDGRFWIMHRVTAYRHIKGAMELAEINGPMACCRGLRHGFGIHAVGRFVPPNLIQRWMGHASPATTAIYLDAMGAEERQFAERMWQ
jgi:integrase/recombinase XerD